MLTELSVNIFIIIAMFLKERKIHMILKDSGLQTSVQALGFLYFKPTKDPIDGVQYLEEMQLLSKFQRANKCVNYNVYTTLRWKELSTSEQDKVMQN